MRFGRLEQILANFNDTQATLVGRSARAAMKDTESGDDAVPSQFAYNSTPMIQLARIRPTNWDRVELDPQQRLDETLRLVENLGIDIPTQVDTKSLFELSLVPPRLVAVREVLRYRMLELSKNACDCFRTSQAVAGSVLTRAAYETSGLLFHIEKRVNRAIEDKTLGDVDKFLLQALLGVKDEQVLTGAKSVNKMPSAVNVLTSITTHLDKQYPGLAGKYAMLCEIAHPNQLGALLAYAEPTVAQLSLASKPDHATPVYPLLSIALKLFEHHYNLIADVFPAFVELCMRDAPRATTHKYPSKGQAIC